MIPLTCLGTLQWLQLHVAWQRLPPSLLILLKSDCNSKRLNQVWSLNIRDCLELWPKLLQKKAHLPCLKVLCQDCKDKLCLMDWVLVFMYQSETLSQVNWNRVRIHLFFKNWLLVLQQGHLVSPLQIPLMLLKSECRLKHVFLKLNDHIQTQLTVIARSLKLTAQVVYGLDGDQTSHEIQSSTQRSLRHTIKLSKCLTKILVSLKENLSRFQVHLRLDLLLHV